MAYINTTPTNNALKLGLQLTDYLRRSCGRIQSGCSSVMFPVGGFQYRQVCARAIGYRFGYNYAFYIMQISMETIIQISTTYNYVDGLSVTHGQSPHTHIWTFASGSFNGVRCAVLVMREYFWFSSIWEKTTFVIVCPQLILTGR